jgi:hypothetical protein
MKPADVVKRVEDIRNSAGDDEKQHSKEGDLYLDLIKFYANNGCELAKEALKTQKLDFSRWCS